LLNFALALFSFYSTTFTLAQLNSSFARFLCAHHLARSLSSGFLYQPNWELLAPGHLFHVLRGGKEIFGSDEPELSSELWWIAISIYWTTFIAFQSQFQSKLSTRCDFVESYVV
jgi:hypothetical protein